MIIIPFGFMAPGVAPTPDDVDLLLNNIPYATGAFALRKLDKNYTGSCIKVRESAGNTLADIGFDSNGDLDTTALLAHTGGNSGYVHTWYDQSGLGYNGVQTTNGSQPRIVDSGTVDTLNSEPAILLDGTGFFDIAIPNTTNFVGLMVASTATPTASYTGPALSGPGLSRSYIMMHLTDNRYYTKNSAGAYAYSDTVYTDSDQHLLTAYGLETPTIYQYRDGDVIASTQLAGGGTASFGYIGKDNATTQRGYLQEIVYYDEDRYIELTKGMTDIGAKYRGWSDYSLFSTEFDGIDDYVDLGRVEPSTTALSISLWVYATSTDITQGLFTKYSSNDYGVTLWGGTLYFFLKTSAWDSISVANYTTTYLNQWTHICCTWNGSTRKIYINGSEEATGAKTGSITYSTNNTRIGDLEGASGWEFSGNIDEVAIWGSDQSSNVATIYNSGVPADLTDLSPTAWWRMGDESGAPYLTNKMAYSKYSMNFDGVADYVDTGMTIEDMLGSPSNNEFTISFWVKHTPNSTYNGMVGATTNTGWTDGIGIYTYIGGVMRLFVNNYNGGALGAKVDTSALTDGQWYHILMCYDADLGSDPATKNLIVYVDGVEAGDAPRGTATGAITGRSNVLELGRFLNNNYNMLGNLDEVAFWNTDKRADVATIYNSGVPNDISGLNPVAYYKMGEGTIFPQIPNEMAYSKQSLRFDAITDYVNVPDDASLDLTNTITLSAWIKPSEVLAQWDGIIYKQRHATNGGYYMGMSSSLKLAGGVKNVSNWQTIQGTTTLLADVWQHVAVVIDLTAETLKLYLNGVLDGSNTSYAYPITGNNDAVYIGAGAAVGENFQGLIDDCAIFNTALPATGTGSIEEIYNNGSPADISAMSGLVSYWKMGDGDYFPTITDNVGSNDGTAENMSGADIKLDTPNGWGTAYNETAAEMIQGDTPGGNGGTMMINMTQADIVQDAPKYSRLSVSFDGLSEFVQLGEPITGADPKTVSMWIKPTSITSNDRILSNYDNTNHALSISFGASAIEFYASGIGNQAITTVMPTVGEWSHLVIVWAGTSSSGGGTATGYLNGGNSATATIATGPHGVYSSAFQNISLGAMLYGIWGTTFHGNIDEVAMWGSALTLTEITTIYNNGRPTDISSLSPVGWWRMGEGSTYPTIIDDGSGSNNGAMTNMAAGNIENDTPE